MSKLTGPLYSRVFRKVSLAKPTGTRTHLKLLQQRICIAGGVCPPLLYHVALHGESDDAYRIFEHGPVRYDPYRTYDEFDTLVLDLPPVRNSLEDISAFEATLPSGYLIGVRDCRHHVLDLLDYLYQSD